MDVTRLQHLEDCERLCAAWDCMAHGNVFRQSAWLHSWWRHYGSGRQLYVLRVDNDQGQTVGVAPWYLETTMRHGRVVRPLGGGEVHSDYLGILATSEYEQAVARSLAEWMTRASAGKQGAGDRWHGLQLSASDSADPLAARLAEQLRARGHSVHRRSDFRCWRLALPDTWDAYLARLSKGRRKQVRRLIRRHLDTRQVLLRTAETADQLERVFAALIELHQRRWTVARRSGCFASRPFTEFLREGTLQLLQQGPLKLFFLEHEGRIIAVELCLLGGDTVYAYQSGIARQGPVRSPGTLLEAAILREAIEQGFRVFDFLRGDEAYKAYWRARPHPCVEYRIASRDPAGLLRHQAWVATDTMRQWVRAGLHAAGLA